MKPTDEELLQAELEKYEERPQRRCVYCGSTKSINDHGNTVWLQFNVFDENKFGILCGKCAVRHVCDSIDAMAKEVDDFGKKVDKARKR